MRWVTLDKSCKARDPLLLGDASVSLTSSLRPVKVLEDPFKHCQMPYFIGMALIINHHHTNLCLTIDVHNFTHQSPRHHANKNCPRIIPVQDDALSDLEVVHDELLKDPSVHLLPRLALLVYTTVFSTAL